MCRDRADKFCELSASHGTKPGQSPLPPWGTLAPQPGPRFQQIGDGDGGESRSPIPDKSGTDAPSPSPDKSGSGTGTGTGVSAPWSNQGFWGGSSFNDGTTQTVRDPALLFIMMRIHHPRRHCLRCDDDRDDAWSTRSSLFATTLGLGRTAQVHRDRASRSRGRRLAHAEGR